MITHSFTHSLDPSHFTSPNPTIRTLALIALFTHPGRDGETKQTDGQTDRRREKQRDRKTEKQRDRET
eukprot:7280649-Karenia_brevis.AAC.1